MNGAKGGGVERLDSVEYRLDYTLCFVAMPGRELTLCVDLRGNIYHHFADLQKS